MDFATVELTAHLFTKCPHCGASIDLFEPEYNHDDFVSKCIFHNAWDELKLAEFECKECGKSFNISEVEY